MEREYANDDFTVMLPRHLTLDDDFNDVDDLDNDDHDDASVYVKSVPVRQNDQHRRMTEMTWLSNSSHSKVPRHQDTLIGMISVSRCRNFTYSFIINMNVTQTVRVCWSGQHPQKIPESSYFHDSEHRIGLSIVSITGEKHVRMFIRTRSSCIRILTCNNMQ